MIFTECVYCGEPFTVSLDERYLELLKGGRQLVSKHKCEKCRKTNYVEHKRVGGETFGEDDKRAKKLKKVGKEEGTEGE